MGFFRPIAVDPILGSGQFSPSCYSRRNRAHRNPLKQRHKRKSALANKIKHNQKLFCKKLKKEEKA